MPTHVGVFFKPQSETMTIPLSWTLKTLEIKSLKENPKNPREITKEMTERLSGLISKFGLIDKPIVNQDLTLIGGHQRIKALKKQKVKVVECWMPDRLLSQEEIDELSIGLNLYQGAWDLKILSEEWNPVDLLEYGFTSEQLLGTNKELDGEALLGEEKETVNNSSKKKESTCPACGHKF